jgi:hypothetical protein
MKSDASLTPLAQLRVIIAHLGEASRPAWWNSGFTTPAGLDFSRYNFTRSYVSGAVAGATVVARTMHDERIGRKGTRHLFRFDAGLERAVHREILEADQIELAALIENVEVALEHLRRLAQQTVVAPDGPVQIGRLGQEERERAVVDIAAHYLSGFESGRIVLPYLAGSK